MLKISHIKTVGHLRNSLPKCLNKVLIFINVSDNVQICFLIFQSHFKCVLRKISSNNNYLKKINAPNLTSRRKHYLLDIWDKCVPKCPTEYESTN